MKRAVIIILAIVSLVLVMAVAYSAFATQLQINGTAEIAEEWNIRIVNIKSIEVSENCDPGEPQFTSNTATFNAILSKPGDIITYEIEIENAGTLNANLSDITFTSNDETGSPAIIYYYSNPADMLAAGDSTTLYVTVEYDSNYAGVPEIKTKTITGTINYAQ